MDDVQWDKIAEELGTGRLPMACFDKWLELKKAEKQVKTSKSWTDDDTAALRAAQKKHGNSWQVGRPPHRSCFLKLFSNCNGILRDELGEGVRERGLSRRTRTSVKR